VAARCPACRSGSVREIERIPARTLAAHWFEQGSVSARFEAADVLINVREDLGADDVRMLRCAKCQLEFADPMRTWSADHYPVQDHGVGFDHATALAALGRGPGRLLEVGCGDGRFLLQAHAAGFEATGVDFAPLSVAAARAAGLDARLASVSSLVEAVRNVGPFEVVAMFQFIEHLETPDDAFADISTVVRAGTRLFIGCPAPERFSRAYAHHERVGRSEFWDYPPQHTMRWTVPALRQFLDRHGWDVVRARSEPFRMIGAAAHLVSADGRAGGWYDRRGRRRLATLARLAQLGVTLASWRCSGIRLFVEASARG
jgi:2-polyprenyl-3-methyl-5-hydroxy-6-metoxy-1,4-benzoquinol methylase